MGIHSTELPHTVRFARLGEQAQAQMQAALMQSLVSTSPIKKASAEPTVVVAKRRKSLLSLSAPPKTALPAEAQALKDKILATQHIKTSRFSLSHMKRLTIPPVELPQELRGRRVVTCCIGGHRVPFSRNMWENRKRRTAKKQLDTLHESYAFAT